MMTNKGGPYNYQEQLEHSKRRITRDFGDAYARMLAARAGLLKVYGKTIPEFPEIGVDTVDLNGPSAIWPSPRPGGAGYYAPETAPVASQEQVLSRQGTAGPGGQQKQLDQVSQHAMSGPRAMSERLRPDQ